MVENELYHYGILGMKWGVRRYQNADGSLTEAGQARYNTHPDVDKGLNDKQQKRYDAEARSRASNKIDHSNYKSYGQKKWEKKVAYETDDKKREYAERQLEVYKQRDDKRIKFAETSRPSYSIARTIVTANPLWNGSYNRIRSGSNLKIGKAGAFFLTNLDQATLGLASYGYEKHQAELDVLNKKK